jgi:hypothetical protein
VDSSCGRMNVSSADIDRETGKIESPLKAPKRRKMIVKSILPKFDQEFWDRWKSSNYLRVEKASNIALVSLFGFEKSVSYQLFHEFFHCIIGRGTNPFYSLLKRRGFRLVFSLDSLVVGCWNCKSLTGGIVFLQPGDGVEELVIKILESLETEKSSRAYPTPPILFVLSSFIPLLVAGGATIESLSESSILVVK